MPQSLNVILAQSLTIHLSLMYAYWQEKIPLRIRIIAMKMVNLSNSSMIIVTANNQDSRRNSFTPPHVKLTKPQPSRVRLLNHLRGCAVNAGTYPQAQDVLLIKHARLRSVRLIHSAVAMCGIVFA